MSLQLPEPTERLQAWKFPFDGFLWVIRFGSTKQSGCYLKFVVLREASLGDAGTPNIIKHLLS